jgi:protocatechuate 3,4-dioxygenase beta subunit
MKRVFILVVLCLLSIRTRVSAQGPAPPPNPASLDGAVVKEPGSLPLKKVLLQLIAEDQKQGSNYTGTTDSDGKFHIDNVQPGRYRFFLERTGFVEVNAHGRKSEGTAVTVQAGQQLKDLLFRMLPVAVIAGRVVDEDGEPMSGVTVSVQRKRPGKNRQREFAGNERTNDLGEYRFSGLFPGQYFVAAVPPPDFHDFARQPEGSPQGDSKPDTRYLTTYYPGVYDGTQAAAITLRAGDETPVSFTLIPARTYRVRGIVTGIPANQKPAVDLVSKAGDSIHQASAVGADGQFEVLGVAPGSYVARVSSAEAQTAGTGQDVTVVAADVEGVKLAWMRPFTLSGHLRLEGQPPTELSQYSVNLHAIDASEDAGLFISPGFFGANAQVDRLGNFQFTSVTPGSYFVQVYGGESRNGFLKSVTLGRTTADTGFTVSGSAEVEILFSSKGGVLEGAVLDGDQPVANASVVAVPEEKYRKLRERFGTASSDQNGHFTIRGLAPGSYTVFAWQDLDEGLYYDADFLKSQEANGTSLKVEEGSHQKIELKLASVSEDWQ